VKRWYEGKREYLILCPGWNSERIQLLELCCQHHRIPQLKGEIYITIFKKEEFKKNNQGNMCICTFFKGIRYIKNTFPF
jgi:hypothetical protein